MEDEFFEHSSSVIGKKNCSAQSMEDEDHSGTKDLFDGYPLLHHHHHHPRLSTEEASGNYTSESPNAKRKVESACVLFCVMRKRIRRDNSVDDMSPDFDYAEKGDDLCCSGSDTDLSECSEFDVISQHVVQDKDLVGVSNGPKSMSLICNSPCPNEDERTLVSSLSSHGGGTSSSTQVRCGDVVNMQGSMKKMLVNKDDEPIPISSVPPDDGSSSIFLETRLLHQTVRCSHEYNAHDDKFGLGISPIPLTKTLEGPSRPWSVCGSIAAVRNIPPLLGDSSGACSSLNEQLYVNVSTSEGRDAELSQTLYQEKEVDGEDEISFSDIDAMIRKLNLIPDDSDSCLDREERNMSEHPRYLLLGLEHCTRTSVRRGIISQGVIAVLHCRDSKHFIRKHEVIIGRSSDGMNVDIDLGKDGYGSKISRRQALVKLQNNGSFSLKNLGKRHILVNGEKLNTGQIVSLVSVDIRGEVFVFKINKEAVKQFLKNNTRRNSEEETKFRWCE